MTTISETLVRVGVLKSTSFLRSGVMVSVAATKSTVPFWSAWNNWSRESGMNATFTFSRPVFMRLFSCSSNSLIDS